MNSKRLTSIVASVRIHAQIRSFSEKISRISGNVGYSLPVWCILPNHDPTNIVVSSCRMRKRGSLSFCHESAMTRTLVISSSRGRKDGFIPAIRRESVVVVSIVAMSLDMVDWDRMGWFLTDSLDILLIVGFTPWTDAFRETGECWLDWDTKEAAGLTEFVPKPISSVSPKIWSIKERIMRVLYFVNNEFPRKINDVVLKTKRNYKSIKLAKWWQTYEQLFLLKLFHERKMAICTYWKMYWYKLFLNIYSPYSSTRIGDIIWIFRGNTNIFVMNMLSWLYPKHMMVLSR